MCSFSFDVWESLKMPPSQPCYVRTHLSSMRGQWICPTLQGSEQEQGWVEQGVEPSTRDTLLHPALLLLWTLETLFLRDKQNPYIHFTEPIHTHIHTTHPPKKKGGVIKILLILMQKIIRIYWVPTNSVHSIF